MRYTIQFKPKALKDADKLPLRVHEDVRTKLKQMSDGLKGDIKHLTHHVPEFRLRVGDYRVLFEVEGDTITVFRIMHRREAYR